MSIEREPLDVVVSSTQLNDATVAQLDNDPDTGDGLWAVATGNNIDTDALVGFPTPSGALNNGADLQEFKARVRPFSASQTGDPKARLELWEAGVLVRGSSADDVTLDNAGGEIIITFTWNATEISAAADVECKFVGTKSGGGPTARNAVDINSIEWNADISSGVILTPDPVFEIFLIVSSTVSNLNTLTPDSVLDTIVTADLTIIIGTVTVTPDAVLDAISVATPVVLNGITVTPDAVVDSMAVAVPTVVAGTVTLTPAALAAPITTTDPTVTNLTGFRVSPISTFRTKPVISSFRQQPIIG